MSRPRSRSKKSNLSVVLKKDKNHPNEAYELDYIGAQGDTLPFDAYVWSLVDKESKTVMKILAGHASPGSQISITETVEKASIELEDIIPIITETSSRYRDARNVMYANQRDHPLLADYQDMTRMAFLIYKGLSKEFKEIGINGLDELIEILIESDGNVPSNIVGTAVERIERAAKEYNKKSSPKINLTEERITNWISWDHLDRPVLTARWDVYPILEAINSEFKKWHRDSKIHTMWRIYTYFHKVVKRKIHRIEAVEIRDLVEHEKEDYSPPSSAISFPKEIDAIIDALELKIPDRNFLLVKKKPRKVAANIRPIIPTHFKRLENPPIGYSEIRLKDLAGEYMDLRRMVEQTCQLYLQKLKPQALLEDVKELEKEMLIYRNKACHTFLREILPSDAIIEINYKFAEYMQPDVDVISGKFGNLLDLIRNAYYSNSLDKSIGVKQGTTKERVSKMLQLHSAIPSILWEFMNVAHDLYLSSGLVTEKDLPKDYRRSSALPGQEKREMSRIAKEIKRVYGFEPYVPVKFYAPREK